MPPNTYHIAFRGGGSKSSIFCMILCAKVTASAMIAFRAGDGLVLSIWQSFRAARIEAIIPSTRFRPSSIRASILLYLPILYIRFLFVYEYECSGIPEQYIYIVQIFLNFNFNLS